MKATLTINYTDGTEENDLDIEFSSPYEMGTELMEFLEERLGHKESLTVRVSSFVLVMSLLPS